MPLIDADARTRVLGQRGLDALNTVDEKIDAIYHEVAEVKDLAHLSPKERSARERAFIEKNWVEFDRGQVDLANVVHELRTVFDPALTARQAETAKPWFINLPLARVHLIGFDDRYGELYRMVRDAFASTADSVARDDAARSHVDEWRKVLSRCIEVGVDHDPPARILVTLNPPRVTLDGTAYPVHPDGAIFVQALVDAGGQWLSGAKIEGIARADRVKKGLPREIAELIDSRDGVGFRLRPLPTSTP